MSEYNWDLTIQTKPASYVNQSAQVQNGCLVRIHPMDLENKLVRITLNKTTIGREPGNDIFCDDTSISRNHAKILKTDHGFILEDCGSTNGTYVDGQPIQKAQLIDGSKIQVGNHIFKFLAGDSIESQYHETVYSMMTKDGLTNVFNKRYLIDAISREFERSQTYGRPFSVVMCDIDYFKKFNDKFGHLAGDEVLQEFAHRISKQCDSSQIFARFGGEEFAILMVETSLDSAAQFAETVRKQIAETPFECCAGRIEVTASFGVAQFDPSSHETFADLLEHADQALYRAKHNGRNQVGTAPQE